MRILWLMMAVMYAGLFMVEYGYAMAQWAGIMWIQG